VILKYKLFYVNFKRFLSMKKIISLLTLNAVTFLISALSFSQIGTEQESNSGSYGLTILLILLFALAVLFASLMIFEKGERKEKTVRAEKVKEEAKKEKGEQNIQERLMDHDYDGIQELDNPPPAWYMYLFYATIVFAIVYMINYHTLGKSNLQIDEYTDEMMQAQQQREELIKSGAFIDENNVKALTSESDIVEGKNIFVTNCVSCHGNNGEGIVGPNLTDKYWIHGGGIVNVFKIIKNGVPEKGMISWQQQLSPKQIQQVASYVLTFAGINPPNAKEPEGELYESEGQELDSLKTESESLEKNPGKIKLTRQKRK
jgi:cytochrome c oxidase cbb3-type subunit 3